VRIAANGILPRRVLVASANRGKLQEIAAILGGMGIEVLAQSEFHLGEAEETGLTFVENAIIKARRAAARAASMSVAAFSAGIGEEDCSSSRLGSIGVGPSR